MSGKHATYPTMRSLRLLWLTFAPHLIQDKMFHYYSYAFEGKISEVTLLCLLPALLIDPGLRQSVRHKGEWDGHSFGVD